MKARALTLPLGIGLCILACDDHPPVVRNCNFDAAVPCPNLNDPAARIEGTITYQGPPPAVDANGVPRGRVVLLLFAFDNPPPPDGTATTAVSFQTVGAAQLFSNATILPNGEVRASIAYSFPGITAGGVYQMRAFYSRGEPVGPAMSESGFHPLFTVRNLPVMGDVGGGAVLDPAAAIPQFVPIRIGEPNGNGSLAIPTDGFVASNVQVFIGRVFSRERPMFHVVTDPAEAAHPSVFTTSAVAAPPPLDTTGVPLPSEDLYRYALDTGLLPQGSERLELPRNYVVQHPETGSDLPTFTARAGFPPVSGVSTVDECTIAAIAGVRCATDPMAQIGFVEIAYDRNANGRIDLTLDGLFADAHPTLLTTSPLARMTAGHLPWIYPLVILTKLHDPTDREADLLRGGVNGHLSVEDYDRLRTSLNRPEALDPTNGRYPILVLGSVLPGGGATGLLLRPWSRGFTQTEQPIRIAVVPIAIEVHGPDSTRDWWGIIPPSVPDLVRSVTPFLPPHYRCWNYDAAWEAEHPDSPDQAGIPVGRYAINIINSDGQAWTIPNELAAYPRPVTDRSSACPNNQCAAPSQALVVRITSAVAPPVPVSCPTPEER